MPHLPRVLALIVLALLLTSCTSPGTGDRITEYDTRAVVHADGTMDVTETITYDFGLEPSPGLLREIPLSERTGFLRHRVWQISDVRVTSPSGAPADIEEQDEWRRVLTLEIGDGDAPVTGEQTYEISYTVHGGLDDQGDGPRLHWDFVGAEWGIPVDGVTVRVEAPSLVEAECFYEESERDSEGDMEYWDAPCLDGEYDGTSARFHQPGLDLGAPLSAVVHLEPGTVEVGEAEHVLAPLPRWLTLVGVLSLVASLTAACLLFRYVHRWRENRRKRIRAGFSKELPDLPPAVAGFLFHRKRLRAEHTLALIVSLEEKGHLTSVPKDDGGDQDWLFVEQRSEVPLSPAEKALKRGMFGLNSEIDLTWMGRFMTARRVRGVESALLREARRHGLCVTSWIWYPGITLFVAAFFASFATPVFVNHFTSLDLSGLTALSSVVFVFALVFVGTPMERTPYGDHVHALLTRRRKKPQGLDPVMGIALGLPDETVRTLNEKVPNLHPYLRDLKYRRRWNRTVNNRISRSRRRSRGGGGSGGGRVSGRGGGGGGGGRR